MTKAKMALNEAESCKKIKEKEAFIFVSLKSEVQKLIAHIAKHSERPCCLLPT